VLVKLPPVEL